MNEFVHLHLHTHFSLLDGACEPEKLVRKVSEFGMPAVAMTDHGNIFGAFDFYHSAKAAGVKPIIGCELYICKNADHRQKPDANEIEGKQYNHLTVLAMNNEGYHNLIRITSEASMHGMYYKPRISKKFLSEHSKGLMALSGCLNGEVCDNLMSQRYDKALTAATELRDIFGKENFFLEIQDQGVPEEKRVNVKLLEMEKELGIPLVATNDSHYLCEDDATAHDVLLCVQMGKSVADPARMRFHGDQFFVKNADQMVKLFHGREDVVKRTLAIAEKCNVTLEKVKDPFPKFEVPSGHTTDSYFAHVSREGMKARFELLKPLAKAGKLKFPISDYEQRLEREIDVITSMRFPGYFLIVWDFIKYAREHGIPVGPGRGSAAGSLVSYALCITDIDPLENGLLFERFLNPERVSLPDIDVDFCMNRRNEVIDYVTQKYGRENVAQIITFGTMAAKASIKDVGRAMDMPYAEVDRIAKMVPTTLNVTLEQALTDSPDLANAYENDPKVREILDTAKRLEGLVRNVGVHAAGVVIAPQPLIELVPLHKTKNDEIVTAFDMKAIEKIGLLKMDFLGLTTLTILNDALKLIEQHRGKPILLHEIPLDDKETYQKVFHKALTSGVFQFESSGMRDVLRRYQPDAIADLTALNALYRPGPLEGGMVTDFIERKWERKKVEYELPELEPILKETLGVIVYQEQVMQIANTIGGYSLGEADLLRRAMGKKQVEEMAKQKEKFVQGAMARKFPEKKASKIFDLMDKFAGYGFNKSHSAAYALLAYQTAYLKTHYPVEFMAALLTSVTGGADEVTKYIKECREMGISVEAPDIAVSDANFTPHGEAIRFGLAAVKNVGHTAVDNIITARKSGIAFKSIYDFCERTDLRIINKRVIESLIKSGAMDALGGRSQLMHVLDKAMERAQKSQRDRDSGQHGLFGVFDEPGQTGSGKAEALPNVPEWEAHQRLAAEKEVLGFFISGHPLEKYQDKLLDFRVKDAAETLEMKSGTNKDELNFGGIIGGLKVMKSRKGELYAQCMLEDMSGRVEAVVFPEAYRRLSEKLKLDVPVLVKAAVRVEEGAAPKIIIGSITPLEEATPTLPRSVRIRIPLETSTETTIDALHSLCTERKGEAKVLFDLDRAHDFMVVMEAGGYNVRADRVFIQRVEDLCGRGSVTIVS